MSSALTSCGRASATSHTGAADCECGIRIAGPIRSSNAIVASRLSASRTLASPIMGNEIALDRFWRSHRLRPINRLDIGRAAPADLVHDVDGITLERKYWPQP